jgi:hypothetical protein
MYSPLHATHDERRRFESNAPAAAVRHVAVASMISAMLQGRSLELAMSGE